MNDSDINYIVPWSLAQIGDGSAIRPLIRALSDQNPSMRVLAIHALAELKATEALPRLRQLLATQSVNFDKLNSGRRVIGGASATASVALSSGKSVDCENPHAWILIAQCPDQGRMADHRLSARATTNNILISDSFMRGNRMGTARGPSSHPAGARHRAVCADWLVETTCPLGCIAPPVSRNSRGEWRQLRQIHGCRQGRRR